MNLYVLLKMVPDTVEELNVAADGKSLDSEFLRFKLSEPDEHALEQALILKEKHGGKVTVVALEFDSEVMHLPAEPLAPEAIGKSK